VILEPRAGECPECGHIRLARTVSWLNKPDEQLKLGEIFICRGCDHMWKEPFDEKSSEEDIL